MDCTALFSSAKSRCCFRSDSHPRVGSINTWWVCCEFFQHIGEGAVYLKKKVNKALTLKCKLTTKLSVDTVSCVPLAHLKMMAKCPPGSLAASAFVLKEKNPPLNTWTLFSYWPCTLHLEYHFVFWYIFIVYSCLFFSALLCQEVPLRLQISFQSSSHPKSQNVTYKNSLYKKDNYSNPVASQEKQLHASITTCFIMPSNSSVDMSVSNFRSFCKLIHEQGV